LLKTIYKNKIICYNKNIVKNKVKSKISKLNLKGMINMKPEKIITVVGTYVEEGENKILHTSTCKCGKLIVRANKQSSLNHYTENPKYHAKCCGSQLTYTGEKLFKGNEIIEPVATVDLTCNIKDLRTPVLEQVKRVERNYCNGDIAEDEKVIKTKKERAGMTNGKMVAALKENINNTAELTKLFNEHEEIFINMIQCVKDTLKLKILPVIQVKYPNAKLEHKNPKVKHIILEKETVLS